MKGFRRFSSGVLGTGVGIVSDRLSGVVGVSVWGISSVVVASGD